MSNRLTKRELSVILSCLNHALAGEIDGGPLEGKNDQDSKRNWTAAETAATKIGQRLPADD